MSDVFISYARSTETVAKQVCEALRRQGYSPWSDDELPAHRSYGDVIEERLKAAKAVVVIWSADAARSQWVRAEADAARQVGTLVQVSVDGTVPPIPFNQIQCANLQGWDGDVDAPGWKKASSSVAALVRERSGGSKSPGENDRKLRNLCICVLPFANMSGDAEQEYFSDGISEDITTDLSNISALSVVARNTAFTFKGSAVDMKQVAQKLNVSHVLEGSVRKAGSRVRVTAQLIDGATGDHVWAERYDRDLTDIFAIQDEISKAIVAALKLKLLPQEKKAIEQRDTTSVEAYNFFLLARQYWINGNYGDIRREQRVMRICSRAVEIDPYYARAWALLANAQSNLRYGFGCQVDDGFAAAHTALAIDPAIAEAYCPMVRRLEENQRYAEASLEMQKALRLDPDSWEVNKEAARVAMRERRLVDATRHFEKAVSAMESDVHTWAMLVTCYHALDDQPGKRQAAEMAVKQAEQVLAHDPSNGAVMSFGAGGFAALGQADRAKEWMDRAFLIDPDNLNMRYTFACALAAYLDEKDAALRLLERVFARTGRPQVKFAEGDPDLDSLRDHPRFQKMMAGAKRRLGIEMETPPAVEGPDPATPAPESAAPLRS